MEEGKDFELGYTPMVPHVGGDNERTDEKDKNEMDNPKCGQQWNIRHYRDQLPLALFTVMNS